MVSIRPFTLDDLDEFNRLMSQIYTLHQANMPQFFHAAYQPWPADNLKDWIGSKWRTIRLAIQDDHAVGMTMLDIQRRNEDEYTPAREYVFIEAIVVDEAHRGHGIGALLMADVEAWARQHGIKTIQFSVWGFNQNAIGFYENLGYAVYLVEMMRNLDSD